MKNFTLNTAIGICLLGLVSFQTTTAQNNVVERRNVQMHQNEPFEFEERGILYYVFADGTFDFNTQPNLNTTTTFIMRRGNSAQAQTQANGVRVDRDRNGRIRRIGHTFINYDAANRVAKIGSVFMTYSRRGLTSIGGLQIFYNRNGAIVSTQGCIQPIMMQNNYQSGNYYYGPAVLNNNHVSYVYRTDGTRGYGRQ
jgi:hypothetical protein